MSTITCQTASEFRMIGGNKKNLLKFFHDEHVTRANPTRQLLQDLLNKFLQNLYNTLDPLFLKIILYVMEEQF